MTPTRTAPGLAAACLLWAGCAVPASAQDAARGQRLFNDTSAVVGREVAGCVTCHSEAGTLRAMLANRGIPAGNARAIQTVLQRAITGAQPGARAAKAQYRGVLSDKDLADLAAYLARVQSAQAAPAFALR